MGEKIKDLGKIHLNDGLFDVEINHPNVKGQEKQIHIQSDRFRFEMDESSFIKSATSIILAREQLKKIKGIK